MAGIKTNDSKVFKLDIGNDLWMSYKCYGFEVERSKVRVRTRLKVRLTAIRRGFGLYECLLVQTVITEYYCVR